MLKFTTKMLENEPEFYRKIIMIDEAHFHLRGYVNKQNCGIWGSENLKIIIEKPPYPQRVTGAVFGQEESFGLIFLKMKLERLFR